jgi:hypothetical protein
MINKVYNSTIIIGITLSYVILGFSYHELYVDLQKDVRLLDSIGFSLFQITHVLLFTRMYLSNKIEKYNFLLLVPIIIQLIDLIPIELLHSLKFTLVSILSIIIGWLTVILNINGNQQKKFILVLLIGIISLIVSWTPSVTVLYSIDNPNNAINQFGLDLLRFDRLDIFEKSGIIYQSSKTIYLLVIIYWVLSSQFGFTREQITEK